MGAKHPIDMLRELTDEFRHRKQENKEKAGTAGYQRRFQTRSEKELENDFKTLLAHWVADEELKQAWHDHFYHFEAEPPGPALPRPPLFRGRSANGGTSEIREVEGPLLDLVIDGKPLRQLSEDVRLTSQRIQKLHVGQQEFAETFEAPEPAQESLADFYAHPDEHVPWEHAGPLFTDGLIDVNFGLTERGKRWLDARRNGPDGGVEMWL